MKENASSKGLFDQVVKIKSYQTKYDCMMCVTHCSVKRKMSQGTDRLFRGILNQGTLRGEHVCKCTLLNLNVVEI